ncbi:hypothetical protein LNQ81_13160 [Myroides sp. M-43]|uniref:hypothetical protein n=1 Tax=Myroides oncorhynchi TaxID=2893756 RepID=UPI001E5A5F31|nr:hypothetical protein [Myroides oncorhynchi]MCC9043623.1 hypothetical protein [Myroides oncorhynchi]
MTKIKDGTISGTSAVPNLGVILELESVNKGFLTPRLTTQQRDAIEDVNKTDGLLIYNKTTGCFNYWSQAQDNWLSMCGTPPPAVFDISDVQCAGITINGSYKQGEFLKSSNFLTVPVTVTQAGTYDIVATTTNGYYFGSKGTFPTPGNYTLTLEGLGTPNMGYNQGDLGDKLVFLLNNKASTCNNKYVYVDKAAVDFTINCSTINVMGDYYAGKELTSSNKISLKVNVTTEGYWSISTNTVNGYSFRGSGTFTTTGEHEIELLATGKPISSGSNVFNSTSNSDSGSSCSSITVVVQEIRYTVDCNSADIKGIYKQDEPLTPAHTVTLKVNVQATGNTSIQTNTVGGVYFTSGPLSFDELGPRDVVLTAVGTPTTPGMNTYTLNPATGMVSICSFNIDVVRQPVAYSLVCTSIVVKGKYAPNIAMNAENTITVNANVDYIGDYSVSTNTVNGVTFTGQGTFTSTGLQEIVLKGSGNPISGGIHRFTLTTNSSVGANTCNVNIEFVYRKMKILGLGGGTYQPGSASNTQTSRAVLQASSNFGSNGVVRVDGLTIIDGGYNQGVALKNLINNNKIDIIVLGYNYVPNAESIRVLEDFVKNKKGFLIHSQENDATSTRNMINAIANSPTTAVSGTGTTYTNPTLLIDNPLLKGPFGDITNKALGSDVNNSYYVTGFSNQYISLAHQNADQSRSFVLMHSTLGYVYIGDSGWTAGDATNSSTTIWPAAMTTGGTPISKAYNGGITVYNSILYANIVAKAIEYVQSNVDVNYTIN